MNRTTLLLALGIIPHGPWYVAEARAFEMDGREIIPAPRSPLTPSDSAVSAIFDGIILYEGRPIRLRERLERMEGPA